MTRLSRDALILCIHVVFACAVVGCGGSSNGNGGRVFDVPVISTQGTENPPGEIRADSIRSIQAGVDYNLRIYLPFGYAPDKAYPIIYALDGDTNFTLMTSRMDLQGTKAILVAVGRNDRRTKDYNLPGAYTYYKFLTLDLIPYIEGKYKVLGNRRTLEGHSFGGLFVGIALFLDRQGSQYFSSFIAQEGTYDVDATTTATIARLEQEVFEASAGKMPVTVLISDSLQQYFLSSRNLNDKLKSRNYEGLTLKLSEYNQSHGVMFLDSFADSLRILFP